MSSSGPRQVRALLYLVALPLPRPVGYWRYRAGAGCERGLNKPESMRR